MPRASTAAKRPQGAANQRDTRHESGLVGPGRRVQKQKSNGHLNGHARSSEALTTPPLPAPPPATNGHVRHALPVDSTVDRKVSIEALRRLSVGAYSEESSSDSFSHLPAAVPQADEYHRRIDVNAAKNPAVHRDAGPLSLAFTVLQSCPLYDTIAILIVLLQIPPTFLSIIHLLFATLTFVPPSFSTGSGLNFTDIFEGTLGTPSVATIVVVDLLVLLVWLFLWAPLQDIALDLAQTVIALTLGGGTSGREAGMKNVLVCFGIIGASHFMRNNDSEESSLGAIISSSTHGLLGSPAPEAPFEPSRSHKKSAHGWIRSILAIHILTQGVVRYIRDWYVRREKRDTTVSIGDPEAAKGSPDANDAPNTQTTENDSSTSLPVSNHLVPSSKKKRKQSAQVRIRQPLWAALASTKIVMVKEYETSHAAAESAGTNATDINNLGNAPFSTEADRIWITCVGSDEVHFATSFFPTHTPVDCEDSSGIDKSKPFFVRVNKTVWQPTRVNASTECDKSIRQETCWSGEIFGLAPLSDYKCDFVSTRDGALIFSTSVRTLPPPADLSSVGLSPNTQVPGRPGSPTSTLRTSIATSEVKLAEERNRQKRERKEQRAKQNSARKELEKLNSTISSSGGSDDRLRQKIQQSQLHMKQAEDAFEALDAEIDALESLPAVDDSEYKTSKAIYQTERDEHKKQRSRFVDAKQAADEETEALKSEIASLQQKRERMQARILKLNGEHERITDANAHGIDEAQRKAAERQRKAAERMNMEMMLTERLQAINGQIDALTMPLQELTALVQAMQVQEMEMYQAAQTGSPAASVPSLPYVVSDIPEGTVPVPPASYPWNPPPTAALYNPTQYTAGMSNTASLQGIFKRGRSSSMHSNISGFTQSSGEGPIPKQTILKLAPDDKIGGSGSADRKDSSASGSGSASGPGSVGDPKSPTGSSKAAVRWGSGVSDDKGN
jgi:ubiquitination network signaling protein AcrB